MKNNWLAAVLLLSFLLTAGYASYHRIEPRVDARAYDQMAVNLLEGYGFKEIRESPIEFDPGIVRAGPAYQFFLTGIYFVFGRSYEAVWLIQALLHILTAYLIFLICRRIFPDQPMVGLVGAAIFAFHPDLIEISAMLMTETLYLFLVTLVIYVFVVDFAGQPEFSPPRKSENLPALPRWKRGPTRIKFFALPRLAWSAAGLGLISGLAILSRPPVILFVPVFLLFYILRKDYKVAVIFLSLLILTLLPWTVRNWQIYGQFIPTTLIGEYNLWVGNTLESTGGQIASFENPSIEYGETFGYLGFKEKARNEFKNFIFGEPLAFVKLTGLRIIRYFSLIRPMGFWFYQSGLPQLIFVALSGLSIATLFILGFAGSWVLWKEKGIGRWLIILLATAPLAIIFATVESRYRFQIYPLLAIFAADFLLRLIKEPLVYRKTLLTSLGIFLLISLIDLAAFWPTVTDRLGLWFN